MNEIFVEMLEYPKVLNSVEGENLLRCVETFQEADEYETGDAEACKINGFGKSYLGL